MACLKKALLLDPVQWITLYNLGLASMQNGQHCSAFHYF